MLPCTTSTSRYGRNWSEGSAVDTLVQNGKFNESDTN